MVTKEEIKKEVDNLPDNLLNEVYSYLKEVTERNSKKPMTESEIRDHWEKWWKNLKNFWLCLVLLLRNLPLHGLLEYVVYPFC